jgi:formyl-CoA transferase
MLQRVPHPELGHTTQIGIVPKLSATPGTIRHTGPATGADTRVVLEKLGLAAEAVARIAGRNAAGAR